MSVKNRHCVLRKAQFRNAHFKERESIFLSGAMSSNRLVNLKGNALQMKNADQTFPASLRSSANDNVGNALLTCRANVIDSIERLCSESEIHRNFRPNFSKRLASNA